MTGTWKRRIVWMPDSQINSRRRAKSQSALVRLDRRRKRREHHSITKEAVDSWYADGADTLYDYLYGEFDIDHHLAFWEAEPYENEDYEDFSQSEWDDYLYDDWYYYDYHDEPAHWGSREVSPEDKRFIEREDVGKSLGEILEELRQKRD